MTDYIKASLEEARSVLDQFLAEPKNLESIAKSVEFFVESFNSGGRVFSCGNGGSMCDSMHFAEELTGRYRKDRRALPAQSMGDPGHLTCVANDFGYEHIFSRIVDAFGKQGDSLLAISTSGNSENVLLACETARSRGMKIVGLLGKDGGKMKDLVDVPVIVPSNITDRIQEVHIKLIHILIQGVERKIFPEHYA